MQRESVTCKSVAELRVEPRPLEYRPQDKYSSPMTIRIRNKHKEFFPLGLDRVSSKKSHHLKTSCGFLLHEGISNLMADIIFLGSAINIVEHWVAAIVLSS